MLIIIAQDSANNYSLNTGYFWLPKEHKWKLIGTCKIKGQWRSIQHPGIYFTNLKKKPLQIKTEQAWCQRNNGKWKNLLSTEEKPPVINLQSHIDSLSQFELEKRIIEQAVSIGKSDARENVEGVYYKIIKEGTGKQIALNNTVSVFYKGYLFSDKSVFDETKDKPVSFPLNRLVKGWKLGLPLCKVGGKIKLVIPSALAYSIRTVTSTIPPNSILVFEIEVLDSN